MYSTFFHIHHIQDWFAEEAIEREAREYARTNDDLFRCGLIANLWKHGKRHPRITVRPGRLPAHIVITASNVPELAEKPTIRFPFVFEHGDGRQEEMESADLAERGLAAWADFIAARAAAGRLDPLVPPL